MQMPKMSRAWQTDSRDRASKTYLDKHAQLASEVQSKTKPRTLAHRSAKQVRSFVRSELFRLFAETI